MHALLLTGGALIALAHLYSRQRTISAKLTNVARTQAAMGRTPICPIEQGHEQAVCPAFPSARAFGDDPGSHTNPPTYRGPTDTILLPGSGGRTPYTPTSL